MIPKGFVVTGVHAGIAKKKKNDLALIYSLVPANAAGMFTANLVKAAPVLLSREHLKKGKVFRGIVANSGNANACTGATGMKNAALMAATAARLLGGKPGEYLVASTGVIGQQMPAAPIARGVAAAADAVRAGKSDEAAAVSAIMTTDTLPKVSCRTVIIAGKKVTVWGCAKGAGMIHPDLRGLHATMLSFILTDAAVSRKVLEQTLTDAVRDSFNCVTVDSDTSTNDTLLLLANGAAGNKELQPGSAGCRAFAAAVAAVCLDLARLIARDGEGATRLVTVNITGASTDAGARKIAATIATSPLVKTAIFGNDANWGRVIAAAGRAGVAFDPDRVDISLGSLQVARQGGAVRFSEAAAKKILQKKEVSITLNLHQGNKSAVYYTCDYSFDYIKINASYRS
jgi:glutamate N-acetyltransferase/amino-acid N-acetyltransferase